MYLSVEQIIVMKRSAIFLMVYLSLTACGEVDQYYSVLQTVDVQTKSIDTVYTTVQRINSPNWISDQSFLVNCEGNLYTVGSESLMLNAVTIDSTRRIGDAHLLTDDGKNVVFCKREYKRYDEESKWINTMHQANIETGEVKELRDDFSTLVNDYRADQLLYSSLRKGDSDIYLLDLTTDIETAMTDNDYNDQSPSFSANPGEIYFISDRSGSQELYVKESIDAEAYQLTNNDYSNWHAHSSPTGKHIVFISYIEEYDAEDNQDKNVKLRLLDTETRQISDLTNVFVGGRGTINAPSWSPDGRKLAFISYNPNGKQRR